MGRTCKCAARRVNWPLMQLNAIPSRSIVGSQLNSSYQIMCSTSLLFQIVHHTTRLVYGLTLALICILHLTFINLHTCLVNCNYRKKMPRDDVQRDSLICQGGICTMKGMLPVSCSTSYLAGKHIPVRETILTLISAYARYDRTELRWGSD